MASTYTVDDVREMGWYWKEVEGEYGREAILIGRCLESKCLHQVKAVARRAVVEYAPEAGEGGGSGSMGPGPWTHQDLPESVTCACGQHDGEGCGATYNNVDQLLPVR